MTTRLTFAFASQTFSGRTWFPVGYVFCLVSYRWRRSRRRRRVHVERRSRRDFVEGIRQTCTNWRSLQHWLLLRALKCLCYCSPRMRASEHGASECERERESERESGRVWTVELASKKERVREWTKPFSASAAFSKFYLFKNLFNSPSLCSSHPPLSFPPEFAFALISICLRFASPLGQSCLFLSRRLNSASTFLLRSVLRLPKVSGIFSSPFVSESRHAPAYPTRWGGGCASVQVNCLSERLGEKRDKLSKTIRRLTSGCMGNKTCKSKNCEPRISQFFLREWKFETCFAKQSHGEHFVVKVV